MLRAQEIPYEDPHSRFHFQRPFNATQAALSTFGVETLLGCLALLQHLARERQGLHYLRVFEDPANTAGPNLWLLEDALYVTALLPSDY